MIIYKEQTNNFKLKYTVLFDAVPLGLILLDTNGNILEVNQLALNILSNIHISDIHNMNLLSNEDAKKSGVSDLVLKSLSTKSIQSCISKYESVCGCYFHMKVTTSPIINTDNHLCINDNDNICNILIVLEDLTESELLKDKYFKISQTLIKVVDSIESFYIWDL